MSEWCSVFIFRIDCLYGRVLTQPHWVSLFYLRQNQEVCFMTLSVGLSHV